MRSMAVSAVFVAAVVGAGCNGSGGAELSRDAHVYVAAIRDVLEGETAPTDPDVLLVVYVVGVGEEEIAADVQAEVAVELDEEADVRFADERAEAVREDEDGVPVRDDGVLIAVGEVASEGEPVEVTLEVYRSEADWSKRVVTIARRSSQWTVTSSSVLPADDA